MSNLDALIVAEHAFQDAAQEARRAAMLVAGTPPDTCRTRLRLLARAVVRAASPIDWVGR